MSFELEGKLIEKFNEQQVSNTFKKREFVVEKVEVTNGREFIETIKFQLIQDKCSQIEPFQINDIIKVSFNIKGRKWEKNGKVSYFTNLDAWRIEKAAQNSGSNEEFMATSDVPIGNIPIEDNSDDLPF